MNLPPLSTWARNVSPSPTLAVDAKAKALQAAGEDVCGFAAGEPDFDTPEHIKEACIAALKAGKTKYAPTPGIESLRQAIVERYLAEYGLKLSPRRRLFPRRKVQLLSRRSRGLLAGRRGDRARALLGELSGDGETGRRDAALRARR